MDKIYEFIKTLEDYELAFLYFYKFKEYMPKSRDIIKKEIEKRGISDSIMSELITEKINLLFDSNNSNKQCSYCKSFHFHSKTEQYFDDRLSNIWDTLGAERPVKYVLEKTCSVCGKPFNESCHDFRKRTKISIN